MLFRQTLLYLPAQLLGPLSQFVAALVWTFLLGLDEYGHLMIVLSAQELVSLLCLSWWTHYTMRYIGTMQDETARKRFQASENAVLLATSVAQTLVMAVILLCFVKDATAWFFVLSILYTLTRCYLTHLAERARVDGHIADYTMAQTIGPLGGTVLGLVLMLTLSGGATLALAGYVAAQLLSLALVWSRLRLGFGLARPERGLLRAASRYGLPLLIAGAFGWASMNGIRLIVENMQGAAAVGLLSVGWGLGQRAISVVAMLVTAAAYPLALQHMNAGAREKSFEQVSLNGALILGVLAPATAGIMLISDIAVGLVVAEPFRAMSALILPVAVAAAALRNSRVHFLDQVILLVEKPNSLLHVNMAEAVATLAFCALGLFAYGLPGAAAGCIPGALVGWVYCYRLTRGYGLRLPLLHFGKIGVATAIMSAVVLMLPSGSGASTLAMRILIGAGVYGLAILAMFGKNFRGWRVRELSKPVS